MDLAVVVLAAFMTLVIVPIAVSELGEWSPWLARRLLVRRAVRRLPEEHQERYEEEWLAELEALPSQKYAQLVKAAQLALSASRMRSALLGVPSATTRYLKGTLDRVAAVVLLVVMAPVFAALAVAVLRAYGRPVLVGERRVGPRGRVFVKLRFRTRQHVLSSSAAMCWAAQDLRDYLQLNMAGGGWTFVKHWDRQGRLFDLGGIGLVLRLTTLDKLPRLLNVLRGDLRLANFLSPRQ